MLKDQPVDHPDLGRYKGLKRRCWYLNQQTFHHLATISEYLAAADIPVLIIKGAALAHTVYPHPYLRPMDDGDILVPRHHAEAAIDVLCDHEWQPFYGSTREALKTYVVNRDHSFNFENKQGTGIDLHWRLCLVMTPDETQQPFWDAAVPFSLGKKPARTLCPTDHLFHACVHGIVWNQVPALRWILDSLLILRKHGSAIEWDRLVAHAKSHQLCLWAFEALNYLRDEFDAEVPTATLDVLSREPITDWQNREFQVLTQGGPNGLRDYYMRERIHRFRNVRDEWRDLSAPVAYSRFLQLHWELEYAWQIPLIILQRLGQKAKSKLGR